MSEFTQDPRGYFISLEGGEGAGKSTVVAALRVCLEGHGIETVQTREPGGTSIGEAVRDILLDRRNGGLVDASELLLMFAARAQLVREVIEPALARGAWILSDRFTDSSFAYQGGGRGIDAGFITTLERHVVGIEPDLTLLLDLPVEEGQARLAASHRRADRIEIEAAGFFERVRAAYLARAADAPHRFRVIDASESTDAVAASASAALCKFIAMRSTDHAQVLK